MMDRALGVRVLALYGPAVVCLLAGLGRKQPARQFVACLLGVLWVLPSLLVLQRLNAACGWWVFAPTEMAWRGMPLELYVGWVVLWGVLPQIVLWRMRLWMSALLMVGIDVVAMPLMRPVVVLGAHWWMGEGAGVALVLLPALAVARWTFAGEHLALRAAMQVAISGSLFLFWFPEMVFALRPGAGWNVLLQMPVWERQIWLQLVLACSIPGVGAVMEFAQTGGGTPIPYDPPPRLVVTGIYRYCANPMQVSCAVVMVIWAVMLHSGWLGVAAGLSIVYSAGIAGWDEGRDLDERFGGAWRAYRKEVRNWRPRWRPYHQGAPATIYIAASCGVCSEVRRWIERRRPVWLQITDAETLPAGSIRRMTYERADGTGRVDGIRAFGRALEHISLGWALAGTALRLPGVWQVVQLVMDASGLGPRTIPGGRATCSVELPRVS